MAESTVVHDPQVLRAIAHPVRNRILGELDAHGSLRAADVARELEIPANQASFHLRQLAKYGLIEEDPGAARDKRDRVWRTTGGVTINLEQIQAVPGGRSAARVYRDTATSWHQYVVATAYSEDRQPGIHRSVTDTSVRLTTDEAKELTEELNAVIDRWAERTRTDADGVAGRRTHLYLGVLQPYPGRPEPEAGDDA